MRSNHRYQWPLARLTSTVCCEALGLALVSGLLASSPVHAHVVPSANAAPAALWQAQQTAEKSSTTPQAQAIEPGALPAPVLVAPSCGKGSCMGTVGRSDDAKASSEIASGAACEPFPAQLHDSPVCGARHGSAIDRTATERAPLQTAGGGPPIVVDSWLWLWLRSRT